MPKEGLLVCLTALLVGSLPDRSDGFWNPYGNQNGDNYSDQRVHACPMGFSKDSQGQCHCPEGHNMDNYGQCVPCRNGCRPTPVPEACPPCMHKDPVTGQCVSCCQPPPPPTCPPGMTMGPDGQCRYPPPPTTTPPPCPPGMHRGPDGRCACLPGMVQGPDGQCRYPPPPTTTPPPCPPAMHRGPDGRCVCLPGMLQGPDGQCRYPPPPTSPPPRCPICSICKECRNFDIVFQVRVCLQQCETNPYVCNQCLRSAGVSRHTARNLMAARRQPGFNELLMSS